MPFYNDAFNPELEYFFEVSNCILDLGQADNPYFKNNVSTLLEIQADKISFSNQKGNHNLHRQTEKSSLNRHWKTTKNCDHYSIMNVQKPTEEKVTDIASEEFQNFIVNIRPELIDFLLNSFMLIFTTDIPYEAFFLSVNLMDRYYGKIYSYHQQKAGRTNDIRNRTNVEFNDKLYMSYYSDHSFMLVCLGALSLATKYYHSIFDSSTYITESKCASISIDMLRRLSSFIYTNDQIIRAELDLLVFLEGKIGHFISVGESIGLFLSLDKNDTTESEQALIQEISTFVCILSQYNIDLLMFNNLELSYSCYLISRYIIQPERFAKELEGDIIVQKMIEFLVSNQNREIQFTPPETSYHITLQANLLEIFSQGNSSFFSLIGGNFTKKLASLFFEQKSI
ncbi:hypothetical protein NADFUDRAFT_40488 [Nadsonia fulvescens var. elongata DSM 6958]|uniref:Uncharacterized protein n=1 Tax=Nadsonia fulvescens var. elongata DSM 6958 TaxID=857566 RepID=A0A1E3PPG3_9ASCO|nr:hypothetical protein NADFUDRAFT_40488 [Nadsonia fulvescens var. elongata DSM 6958]